MTEKKPSMLDDIDHVAGVAAAAFEEMARRSISPTPPNFCVWYNYLAMTVDGLRREVDAIISAGGDFNPHVNQQLFYKYFGVDQENAELRRAGEELRASMGGILAQVDQAGVDTATYGATLTQVTGSLGANAQDPTAVREITARLLSATMEMAAKNKALEGQLQRSGQEITSLEARLTQMRREALTDALTGIGNRRCFDLALMDLCSQAPEGGESDLCLLLLDIDHFKKFNDSYGHRIGDQVLKVVGFKLREAASSGDTPARYGGEEFALLLPNTRIEDAVTRADKLRTSLGGHYLKNKATGDNYGQVTVSIGVAHFRPDEPLESFVRRADVALYEAKHQGRNRVVREAAI